MQPDTLESLLARRAVLLAKCRDADALAGMLREQGKELDDNARNGFRHLDDLRALEWRIAKMREGKNGQ